MLAVRVESVRNGAKPLSVCAGALAKGPAKAGTLVDGPAGRIRKGWPACDSAKATKSCRACEFKASSAARARSQAAEEADSELSSATPSGHNADEDEANL